MPYEIHFVARMWDATESDEHKKLVQRAVQLLSDIEEACGKADAEIEDYSLEWFGDVPEPDWSTYLESGLRIVGELKETWSQLDSDLTEEHMVANLRNEGYDEEEARAILAEIREREQEQANAS